jgi:NAD(P)-dependent dehydrogenase (short-subunit alcohol dehydrogenase family)
MPGSLLSGKTALVTGGGRGIGRALCLGLAREGARVAVADVGDTAATVSMIAEIAGTEAFGVQLDVTDFAGISSAVERVEDQFGPIEILINNAGLYGDMSRGPFDQISEADWDRMMTVNVKGIWNMARAVVPGMIRRGYGKIINSSSTTFFAGPPNMLHYVTSKGAVIALTRSLARELGPRGIRVNTLAPGLTLSEATLSNFALPGREEVGQRVASMTALGRVQTPEDLVGTVVFLASSLSDAITGQMLNVDGGMFHW